MRVRANPLWRFSLRTYRAPGVQEACLALQERCGADVNLLLFCAWTGRGGHVLDERSLQSALDRVGRWQSEVIAPLRSARRALKRQATDAALAACAAPLRRRVLALELELERVEQSLLGDLASEWTSPARRIPPPQAIAANLACYLHVLGKQAGPDQLAQLECIAQASRPARRRAVAQADQAG